VFLVGGVWWTEVDSVAKWLPCAVSMIECVRVYASEND
jgi:hypothetical protein